MFISFSFAPNLWHLTVAGIFEAEFCCDNLRARWILNHLKELELGLQDQLDLLLVDQQDQLLVDQLDLLLEDQQGQLDLLDQLVPGRSRMAWALGQVSERDLA